ncbi:MAG: hypothetical protein CVV56_05565 [Tenericutes bacterium HGW-Tenericutes-1]|jgi:hypothetical protein|nr:MAG: hypothetical protein CVV56_05565 [Tenericutes bacterium HGW-Tenericutes-1]PKM54205.1 MAG: hypothetical protein CVU98_13495 [Firmicutes bacterium HGW-Firmicutes-3]
MKSLKSKVILSAVVLIFALVATIGSTFAWFTVSSTVTASSLTLTVQSQDSLLIKIADPDAVASEASANTVASLYRTILDEGDIVGTYPIVAARLKPVTAINAAYDALDGDVLNVFSSNAYTRPLTAVADLDLAQEGGNGYSANVNTATGGVIQVRFWIMSQTAGKNLRLSAFTTTGTDQAVNAIRMSVWLGDYSGSTSSFIYTPSTGSADYEFAYLDGQTGYDDSAPYTLLDGFNQLSDLSASLSDDLVATHSIIGTSATGTPGTIITALTINSPVLVTCMIYVEGWDAQTTNEIIDDSFDVSFSFTIE